MIRLTPAVFLLALTFLPLGLEAQTITWDGGGDGTSFSDGFNWVGDAALLMTLLPTSLHGVESLN